MICVTGNCRIGETCFVSRLSALTLFREQGCSRQSVPEKKGPENGTTPKAGPDRNRDRAGPRPDFRRTSRAAAGSGLCRRAYRLAGPESSKTELDSAGPSPENKTHAGLYSAVPEVVEKMGGSIPWCEVISPICQTKHHLRMTIEVSLQTYRNC